ARGVQVRPVTDRRGAVHGLPGLGGRGIGGRLTDREGRGPRVGPGPPPGARGSRPPEPRPLPPRPRGAVAPAPRARRRVAVPGWSGVVHGQPGVARAEVVIVVALRRRPVPGGELAGRIERRRLAGRRGKAAHRALARGAARSVPSAVGQDPILVLSLP